MRCDDVPSSSTLYQRKNTIAITTQRATPAPIFMMSPAMRMSSSADIP